MTQILKNSDLAPKISGIETCAACVRDIAFYTGNWFAAYSIDSGTTFGQVSPYAMMQTAGFTFCCDQRIEYVPRIDTFVWVLLSNEGPLMLAVASPDEVRNSKAKAWTYYVIKPETFRIRGEDTFDYPQISFGDNYLYLTVNSVGTNQAVITRFPLEELAQRATLHGEHVKVSSWFVCPCHNTREAGWFGVAQSDSEIRVFKWDEPPGAPVKHFDFPIATVPTTEFSSFTRDGDDWLPPTSKINSSISGAARTGNTVVFAWSAGRKYANGEASPFPHTHIEYIEISIFDFGIGQASFATQHSIWNPDFAFAWPSLAASPTLEGKVAISCCFGGGRDRYPQHAVGILGTHKVTPTTSGKSAGAGGHYNDVRLCFPDTGQFVASGFHTAKDNSNPPKLENRPKYVIFSP
jgi:hypothetical protein